MKIKRRILHRLTYSIAALALLGFTAPVFAGKGPGAGGGGSGTRLPADQQAQARRQC